MKKGIRNCTYIKIWTGITTQLWNNKELFITRKVLLRRSDLNGVHRTTLGSLGCDDDCSSVCPVNVILHSGWWFWWNPMGLKTSPNNPCSIDVQFSLAYPFCVFHNLWSWSGWEGRQSTGSQKGRHTQKPENSRQEQHRKQHWQKEKKWNKGSAWYIMEERWITLQYNPKAKHERFKGTINKVYWWEQSMCSIQDMSQFSPGVLIPTNLGHAYTPFYTDCSQESRI